MPKEVETKKKVHNEIARPPASAPKQGSAVPNSALLAAAGHGTQTQSAGQDPAWLQTAMEQKLAGVTGQSALSQSGDNNRKVTDLKPILEQMAADVDRQTKEWNKVYSPGKRDKSRADTAFDIWGHNKLSSDFDTFLRQYLPGQTITALYRNSDDPDYQQVRQAYLNYKKDAIHLSVLKESLGYADSDQSFTAPEGAQIVPPSQETAPEEYEDYMGYLTQDMAAGGIMTNEKFQRTLQGKINQAHRQRLIKKHMAPGKLEEKLRMQGSQYGTFIEGMTQEAGDYFSSLPLAEQSTVLDYTGGEYQHYNGYLRGTRDQNSAEWDRKTKRLEHAAKGYKTKEPLTLHRALDVNGLASMLGVDKPQAYQILRSGKLAGQIISDKGFSSCSTKDLSQESQSGWEASQIRLNISVPAGSHVGMPIMGVSYQDQEDEFLLSPKTKLVVKNVLPDNQLAGREAYIIICQAQENSEASEEGTERPAAAPAETAQAAQTEDSPYLNLDSNYDRASTEEDPRAAVYDFSSDRASTETDPRAAVYDFSSDRASTETESRAQTGEGERASVYASAREPKKLGKRARFKNWVKRKWKGLRHHGTK